jgi:hypothetical protein
MPSAWMPSLDRHPLLLLPTFPLETWRRQCIAAAVNGGLLGITPAELTSEFLTSTSEDGCGPIRYLPTPSARFRRWRSCPRPIR